MMRRVTVTGTGVVVDGIERIRSSGGRVSQLLYCAEEAEVGKLSSDRDLMQNCNKRRWTGGSRRLDSDGWMEEWRLTVTILYRTYGTCNYFWASHTHFVVPNAGYRCTLPYFLRSVRSLPIVVDHAPNKVYPFGSWLCEDACRMHVHLTPFFCVIQPFSARSSSYSGYIHHAKYDLFNQPCAVHSSDMSEEVQFPL